MNLFSGLMAMLVATIDVNLSVYLLKRRYNEVGKPVCRVCDAVLKSDSDWITHQASRKHHEVTVLLLITRRFLVSSVFTLAHCFLVWLMEICLGC